MKLNYVLILSVLVFLLVESVAARSPVRELAPGNDLRVVARDAQSLVLELTVAGFTTETLTVDGQTYDRLLIPDTLQTTVPGAPQVPTRGVMLGLPSTADVRVQMLEAETETHGPYRLPPAPTLSVAAASIDELGPSDLATEMVPDPALFAANAFYPRAPVVLGEVGQMRDQAVAQVHLYPVQYNPTTGDVRLYRRMRIKLTWDAAASLAATQKPLPNPVYEDVLRSTLLNYDQLERPTVAPPSAGRVTRAAPMATAAPALKITVRDAGIYKLTPTDIADAGLDLAEIDPRTLTLSYRGEEVPIHVQGEADGTLDDDDYVLFYGAAINDVYTNQNVYWLTVGEANGLRMAERSVAPQGDAPTPTQFPAKLRAEQDTYYWQTMPDGVDEDHWFWGNKLNPSDTRDYTIKLENIATTADTATIRVRLKGFTDVAANPDHRTRIYLNGTQIDEQTWDGQTIFDHVVSVPQADLQEGDNVVRVESLAISGVSVNQVLVNWIEIDYADTYQAEDDTLAFHAPAAGQFGFNVANFENKDIALFDITDTAGVVRLVDAEVQNADKRHTLRFADSAQVSTRYLALTSAQYKSPLAIERDTPSAWRSTTQGADYIIVTHAAFRASAERLAEHRSQTGLRAAVVDVEDIYDEFNAGIFNPQAIRDFLAYAYANWMRPAPAYVVLLGDAHQDYKDNRQTDTINYVPSQIVQTKILGETPSDNWFVTVAGDDVLPDMFIGRLSAETPDQAATIVDKILAYEQSPPDDAWNTRVLLVADDDESSFTQMSEQIAGLLPSTYTTERIDIADYPPGNPTSAILEGIDLGSVAVNYAGHGQIDGWGIWQSQNFFDLEDAANLENNGRLPVVTVANCLNGFFALEKERDSLAEVLQRQDNQGAVAVWAATGLDYPTGHSLLMNNFYETVFQDGQHDLGVATTVAKVQTFNFNSAWDDLVKTFVLFGDPATSIGVPSDPPRVLSVSPAAGAVDVAVDEPLQVTFSKPMNPATVTLGGTGTANLTPTLTWSNNYTVLTYAHTGFDYNETRTFTVQGQDRQGNAVMEVGINQPWSFTTAAPVPEQDLVTISGPLTGAPGVAYSFGAVYGGTVPPTLYIWTASDLESITNVQDKTQDAVTFTWTTPGTKIVTVTATNAEGAVRDAHVVQIGSELTATGGSVYLPLLRR